MYVSLMMVSMAHIPDSNRESHRSKAELFDRFARYYDGDYRDYVVDVDLILDLASEAGDPILELGCGTGRVIQPLVQEGYSVTGIDISPQLLSVARTKLANRTSADVQLVESDLTAFDLPNKGYRLAIFASNTLMHMTSSQEQTAALANVYRHLAPGALLFIDLFNPDVARLVAVNNVMELADEWEWEERGAHVLKWSVRTVDFAEQLQDTLFIYEEIGDDGGVRRTPCPFVLRFLWRSEAELMLEKCGFEVEAVWGDYDAGPYDAASDRLLFLAKKPAELHSLH
jgi:SAM-dependent methyltransferase